MTGCCGAVYPGRAKSMWNECGIMSVTVMRNLDGVKVVLLRFGLEMDLKYYRVEIALWCNCVRNWLVWISE